MTGGSSYRLMQDSLPSFGSSVTLRPIIINARDFPREFNHFLFVISLRGGLIMQNDSATSRLLVASILNGWNTNALTHEQPLGRDARNGTSLFGFATQIA